jgi:hypothetical protein
LDRHRHSAKGAVTARSIFNFYFPVLAGLLSLSQCGCAASAATAQNENQQFVALSAALQHPECRVIEPFYWELGDASGMLASGRQGKGAPEANTPIAIASATKWLFGAYVVQMRQGQLRSPDIQALVMHTGYVSHRHRLCVKRRASLQEALTVAQCFNEASWLGKHNDNFTPEAVDRYHYNGGHFQFWGVRNGLGALNNERLASSFNSVLGEDLQIQFDSPQLAGGARMSGAAYGRFLRKLLAGELHLGAKLGEHSVCTDQKICPEAAQQSPISDQWGWLYSLGHWVEPDAYSSAGAFGFYPWIAKDRSHYGLIAREKRSLLNRPAPESVVCGMVLRSAWLQDNKH